MGQPFGANWIWFYKALGMIGHSGIDFPCPSGTNVYAVCDAVVTQTAHKSDGMNVLEYVTTGITIPGLEGSYRIRVSYLHLKSFVATMGQQIKAGNFIATANNTGRYTTGSHLHLGVFVEHKTTGDWAILDPNNGFGGCVDPALFFPDNSYELLPVDVRYNQPYSVKAEAYKKAIYWWAKAKLKRAPTDRELNAWAYGGWSFDEVTNDAMFNTWTAMTKGVYLKPPFPRLMGI